jgi:hypothetical protein
MSDCLKTDFTFLATVRKIRTVQIKGNRMIEYIICTILGFVAGITVTMLVLSSTKDL